MSNKELTEDVVLIQQITARSLVNKEIIDRINASGMQHAQKLGIASFLDPSFSSLVRTPSGIKQTKAATGVSLKTIDNHVPCDLLENALTGVLIKVEDFFNDKLNYDIDEFPDLERLNTAMLPIAKKYELFGPTPKAIAVLKQFKVNYDSIHVALGKIEQSCVERQTRYKAVKDQVEQLNKQYDKLVASINSLADSVRKQTF